MSNPDIPVNRRTVLKTAAASLVYPLANLSADAADPKAMLTRSIPSSDLELGVIAYGGSPAFRGNSANDPAQAGARIARLLN